MVSISHTFLFSWSPVSQIHFLSQTFIISFCLLSFFLLCLLYPSFFALSPFFLDLWGSGLHSSRKPLGANYLGCLLPPPNCQPSLWKGLSSEKAFLSLSSFQIPWRVTSLPSLLTYMRSHKQTHWTLGRMNSSADSVAEKTEPWTQLVPEQQPQLVNDSLRERAPLRTSVSPYWAGRQSSCFLDIY